MNSEKNRSKLKKAFKNMGKSVVTAVKKDKKRTNKCQNKSQ